MNGTRTLLKIIQTAWAATGRKGPLTRAFIQQWRESHPDYEGASLAHRFKSGSALFIKPVTRLDRATAAWIAAGNPAPSAPGFPSARFNKFVETYRDEFDEDFYQ